MPAKIPPIVCQGSVIRKEDPNRYADYLASLRGIRSGLTILALNAQEEGPQAGLSKDFVEAEVEDALREGSREDIVDYWGNMELSR